MLWWPRAHFSPAQALRDLNLPITVSQGYLGHLSVIIPWTDLYNKSTEVVLEDVFLLVNPKVPWIPSLPPSPHRVSASRAGELVRRRF